MDSLPWVSITQTGQDIGLRIHPHALSDLSISNSATPQVIVLIGKHEKSHILRQLLQLEPRYPQLPHGQVHLWEDPVTKTSENPNIFVDCELFNSTSAQNSNPASYISPELSKKLIWLDHGNLDEVCTYFMNNVLMPISCVIYYFAADLGGTTNVALLLAKQILKGRKASYSKSTLPRVIIILEASNGLLPTDHTKKFLALLTKAVKDLDPLKSDSDAASSIESQFGSIRATCLGQSNRSVRSAAMRGQMQATVYSLIQCRYDLRVLFSFAHIRAFSSILLENFCASKPIDFSFVKASRPRGFSLDDFSYHLGQALDLMPSEAWLWHFVAPLVASCILVSMYRPGSHCM
jgi:hypothetical protein